MVIGQGGDTQTVVIKNSKIKAGEVQTLRFYNQRQGGLVIKKLDSITKKPLSGVQFLLTYADGSYVDADNGHLSSKENNY